MKIVKTVVEAKTRKLNATYTIETAQDITSEIEDNLAKILQQEIDNEIMSSLLDSQGWHKVTVNRWNDIPQEWRDRSIKGNYHCFGHYWYFENESDAHFFILKWGTQ